MAYKDFFPGAEFEKFSKQHGDDTFIKINLLYTAFLLGSWRQDSDADEFDELCEDVLELALDEAFVDYNLVDVAEGVSFIMEDSSYSVHTYVRDYKRRRAQFSEELLALLKKTKTPPDYGD